jgi:hypothetical protein
VEKLLGRQLAEIRRRKDSLLEFYKAHMARHRC